MSVAQHANTGFIPGNAYLDDALKSFFEHPWLFLLRLVLTTCLATRGVTGLWTRLQSNTDTTSEVKLIPRIPYWIPYLGHQLSFSLHSQSWLLRLSQIYKTDIFTLTIAGRKYYVVTSPDIIACLKGPAVPVTTAPFALLRSRRFFANRYAGPSTSTRIATALSAYGDDKSRIDQLCMLLEANTYNLISPSRSWIDQAQWERNAEVKVLSSSHKPSELSVSASLPALIREFSSHIILSTLLGSSFLESNPSFVGDLFAFGAKYSYFMAGFPYWITPGLGPPALAREKCLLALESLVGAMMAESDERVGDAPSGMGMLYDLDSVHPAVRELVRQARQEHDGNEVGKGLSRKASARAVACEVLEVVWFVNYYAANFVIWILVELFKDGSAAFLRSVREEVMNFVEVVKGEVTGLPFEDPPRLRFQRREKANTNMVAGGMCPILGSAVLETLRLRTWSEEYLEVSEDFVLEVDSGNTVGGFTKSQHAKEIPQLRKGEHLYTAHGVGGHDPRRWNQPERFDAGRCKAASGAESENSMAVVGKRRIKGHDFQIGEEITLVVAAVISTYDIQEVDGRGLSEPGSDTVAGMMIPRSSVRVRVSRRSL